MLSSYLLFAAGFHWLICAARLFPAERPGERLATALLFGPISGAWTFGALLRLFPAMPSGFYLAASLGIWFVAGFVGRRALRADIRHFKSIFARQGGGGENRWTWICLFLAFGSGLVWIGWVNMWVPPYANDPLEYLTVSRLIAGKLALTGVYPAIDTSVTSGFYGPWTHPPGFVLLMSWVQMLQGDAVAAGAVKFINVYFLAAGAMIVFVYAGGSRRFRGAAAAALYTMTPLLIGETFEHHVDVVRVAAWTAAFLAVTSWARRPALASSLALGLLFGLGNFVHSIGLVALPIFAVLALIVGTGPLSSRIAHILAAAIAALAVILPDLVANFRAYGRLIGDRNELWDFAPLMVTEHLRYARGITTPFEIVTQGIMAPFMRFSLFGSAPWLMLAFCMAFAIMRFPTRLTAVWQLARRAMRPTVFSVSALVWLGFFGITVLSVLAGSELIIKNARYALTTIAFSSILAIDAGDLLFRTYQRRRRRGKLADMQPGAPAGRRLIRLRKLSAGLLRGLPVTAATLLGVAFLTTVSLQSAKSLGYANIDILTAGQSDQVKSGLTDQPQLRMIARLNRKLADGGWTPSGKVLSFRVGDVAYYGHFGYVSYIDPAVLPAFKAGSAGEAGEVLARLGVSHIAVPPYSMPEIHNSAIGALLSDPQAARILDSDDGYVLYELLKNADPPAMEPVAGGLQISVTDAQMSESAQLRAQSASGATLQNGANADLPPVEQADAVDIGSYARWSAAENAFFIGAPMTTKNGEHVFSARMSGSGFVRIALVREGASAVILWEGVIQAQERLVSSHFDLAYLNDGAREGGSGPENAYQINVWTRPGSVLRLSDAGLQRVAGRESAEAVRVNLLSRLMLSGYDFGVNGLPASKLELEPAGSGFAAKNLDGRWLTIEFPRLALPDNDPTGQLYPAGRLMGQLMLGGTGFREVSMDVQCNQPNIQSADELKDTKLFSRRYLMTETDQIYAFEADAPCRVKSARLKAIMWRPAASFDAKLPPLAYRFGANRMSFGYTDSAGGWQTREMLPVAERR